MPLAPGRHLWVQILSGRAQVDGADLEPGDGVAVSGEKGLELSAADQGAEFLAFDLA
jgi:redox-sensitive bicupin YhaK (pirin superfamily)